MSENKLKSDVKISEYNDIVYYDIVQTNLSETERAIAKFSSVRSSNILDKANDYDMSVLRFTVPSSTLPIFIFSPDDYVVSLKYGATTINETVVYDPDNDLSVGNSEYYYVYSYQHMLFMINTAYAAAMVDLITAVPALAGTPPPYLVFDQDTKLINLICPSNAYNYLAGTPLEVWFNQALYPFLSGFHLYKSSVASTELDWQFVIVNQGNNYYSGVGSQVPPVPYAAVATYIMYQEFDTLTLWNSPRSLIFTTSKIPVRPEMIPVSQENQIGGLSAVSSATLKIITDFSLATEAGTDIRTILSYNPQAEFRHIDLVSDLPLREIDFSIYWVDKLQNLYPLYIYPLETLTIKIMFRKKIRPVKLF